MKIKLYSYSVRREDVFLVEVFASENARDQDLRRHCLDWLGGGDFCCLSTDAIIVRYENGTDCRITRECNEVDIPELTTAAHVMDHLIEWDNQQGQYEASCWNELRLARNQLRKLEA